MSKPKKQTMRERITELENQLADAKNDALELLSVSNRLSRQVDEKDKLILNLEGRVKGEQSINDHLRSMLSTHMATEQAKSNTFDQISKEYREQIKSLTDKCAVYGPELERYRSAHKTLSDILLHSFTLHSVSPGKLLSISPDNIWAYLSDHNYNESIPEIIFLYSLYKVLHSGVDLDTPMTTDLGEEHY